MKRYSLLFAVCVIAVFELSAQAPAAAEKDFESPEAAIAHFIGGLASNDFHKALQACAIGSQAAAFDFKKLARRLDAIVWTSMLAPSNHALYVRLNEAELISRIARQVKFFCFSLLSEEVDFFAMVPQPSDERLDGFLKASNPARLSTLKIVKIGAPAVLKQTKIRNTLMESAKSYGAQDSTERLVLLEFEQKTFGEGFQLFKYGRAWRINSLSAPILNTAASGAAGRVSAEQFEAAIAE